MKKERLPTLRGLREEKGGADRKEKPHGLDRRVREDRRVTSIHCPGSTYNLVRNLLLKRPARFRTVFFKIIHRHSYR